MSMPVKISGKTFFLMHEALEQAGISRSTLLRWIKEKKIEDTKYRDSNGWRLFTKQEIDTIKKKSDTLQVLN
jgi:predicted site-specific integrase-resolvase